MDWRSALLAVISGEKLAESAATDWGPSPPMSSEQPVSQFLYPPKPPAGDKVSVTC